MARHYPVCEACGRSILEKNVAQGRDANGVHYFHVGHQPGRNPKRLWARKAVRKRGGLSDYGWTQSTGASKRHAALRKLVHREGYATGIRRLLFLQNAGHSQVAHTDLVWMQKTFGSRNPVSPDEWRAIAEVAKSPAATDAVRTLLQMQLEHEWAEDDTERMDDIGQMLDRLEELQPKKNIFFRHRLRERRLRRQLEQAASLQASAASAEAAKSVARLGSKNPHYPAIPGKKFERKWERLVQHVKDSGSAYSPWAVATATLRGYPASRARRNPALRKLGRGVRSFRGRVTRFGRKHQRATRALRTAGKVAAGAATAAVPEVAVPVRAIRGGVSAYREAKGRRRARPGTARGSHHGRNPTLSRSAYLSQQLSRAKTSAQAGRPAEAHKYIDRVVRIVTGAHGDPDENATFLSQARTIEQQIEAGSREMGRREKAIRKMEESLPSLELAHAPPPDPDDEFWGKLAAEAQRRFPGRNLSGAVNDLQYLWHYGIGNRAKHNVVKVWDTTHTLDAINEGFWQVFELYLDRKMREVDGKLVPKEEVGPEVRAVMKNPGKHPVVHGAKAVELTYRDRNGVLWTHDFREDSRETRLHVRKGLTSDAVVLKPTQVTEAGIGDS